MLMSMSKKLRNYEFQNEPYIYKTLAPSELMLEQWGASFRS